MTARRRAEDVQKVPVAVTAVSAQTLRDKQIFEAFQLPSIAPSLQVQSIAKQVGAAVAQACKTANITAVVFDRGGFRYHGRIKAVADGAREGGLQF